MFVSVTYTASNSDERVYDRGAIISEFIRIHGGEVVTMYPPRTTMDLYDIHIGSITASLPDEEAMQRISNAAGVIAVAIITQDMQEMIDELTTRAEPAEGTWEWYANEVPRTVTPTLSTKDRLVVSALGLSGETGELANAVMTVMGLLVSTGKVTDRLKKITYHEHEIVRDELVKELGDVTWYFALLLLTLDIPLSEVLKVNVKKLRARYPDGFEAARSINRPADS